MLLTVDLARLRVGPGDLLLDAGCGEGRHCFGALERGARVVGLDLDLGSLKRANHALRERAREKRSFGGMLQGDAFKLPFASATFDRVICAEVMEHVHDYPAAARELARVTKPGGRIAVTIPTTTSELLYLRLGDDYFESPGGHIRIFTPRDLAKALGSAGLRTEGCSFAHGLHTPYWALRSIAGLPRADESALVRAYRLGLIRATASRFAALIEKYALNYICPKSVVLYAEKPA
ncbi:MAG: methyltransferase domain-containing protein [Deltaproteobacteria bacterium]|nr:methyltransferase domain-containing protein [Deltaproteobacteria bacterium]